MTRNSIVLHFDCWCVHYTTFGDRVLQCSSLSGSNVTVGLTATGVSRYIPGEDLDQAMKNLHDRLRNDPDEWVKTSACARACVKEILIVSSLEYRFLLYERQHCSLYMRLLEVAVPPSLLYCSAHHVHSPLRTQQQGEWGHHVVYSI